MTINGNALHYPLATLYVGDLDSNITEAHLFEKFSAAGPVVSIRVCRDQITKHSLGYAYVNFQQQADAERALDTMNFDTINGRPMRIMWSQRDPALRKSGVGNVFIKNLDKSIDNKALYDTFSTFGNILSCKIMIDEHGNSKGYGFVHFETQEAADKAIKSVNNMLLNNKKVFVGEFVARTERDPNEIQRKFTNVFVKNFGTELNEEKLKELFERYGEVTSVAVAKNEDGTSKGYGFVNFKESHCAADAVKVLHDSDFQGQKLFVGPFQKKQERAADLRKKHEEEKKKAQALKQYAGVNLYVKNLDDNFDDERLRKEFATFGQLSSVRVMTDESGRSKGFGFVCYVNPDEATKALNDMNGRIIGTKPLFVAIAQRKEERKSQLASQYMQRMMNIRLPHHHAVAVQAAAMMQHQQQQQQQQQQPAPHHMYAPSMPTMHQPRFASHPMMQQQQQRLANRQMYPTSMQQQQQQPMRSMQQQQRPQMASRPRINYYQQQQPQQQQQQQQNLMQNQQIRPQPQPLSQQQQQQQQLYPKQQDQSLTLQLLAEAPPQEQKQLLGERLYPLIQNMHPEWAGKITGMLLEIDNAELLHMLESNDALKVKVNEAILVLQAHQAKIQQVQ